MPKPAPALADPDAPALVLPPAACELEPVCELQLEAKTAKQPLIVDN
ncbi:MAG TPA: hypothetical protein VIK01_19400 [Polyangiaceae bacterium]